MAKREAGHLPLSLQVPGLVLRWRLLNRKKMRTTSFLPLTVLLTQFPVASLNVNTNALILVAALCCATQRICLAWVPYAPQIQFFAQPRRIFFPSRTGPYDQAPPHLSEYCRALHRHVWQREGWPPSSSLHVMVLTLCSTKTGKIRSPSTLFSCFWADVNSRCT